MLIFLVISTALFGWTGAQKQENSSLELITEDFLTLSRITNAIYLQSLALRNATNPREVISELLKIAPQDFNGIVDIDANSAIELLKKLDENINRIPKNSLVLELHLNDFKKQLKKVEEIVMLSDPLGSTTPDDLRSAMDEMITVTQRLKTDCDESKRNDLISLLKSFKLGRKKRNAGEAKLKEFAGYINSLISCFQSTKALNEKLSSMKYSKTQEKYRITMEAIERFLKWLESLSNVSPGLKHDLEIKKELWTETNMGTIASQFDKTYHAIDEHVDRLEPPLPVLTVSFLEPKDLLKVPNDLKSKFFQKHFVKGANSLLKKLWKALKPFNDFSKVIQELDELWNPFNPFNGEVSAFKDISDALKSSEYFLNRSRIPGPIEVTDESIRILQKCTFMTEVDYNITEKEFVEQEEPHQNFRRAFNGFLDKAKTKILIKTSDGKYPVQLCLEEAQQLIAKSEAHRFDPEAYDIISKTESEFKKCIRAHSSEKFTLAKVADSMGSVEKERNAVLKKYDEIGKTTTTAQTKLEMKDILVKSKVLDASNCLRNEKFQPQKLNDVADAILFLHHFPDSSKIEHVVRYLNFITKHFINIAHNRGKRAVESPILALNNSELHAENIGICSIALFDLVNVQKNKERLSKMKEFRDEIQGDMGRRLKDYRNPKYHIGILLEQADGIEKTAKDLWKTGDLVKMSGIFEPVSLIDGMEGELKDIIRLIEKYEDEDKYPEERKQLQYLSTLQLDFVMYQSRLKDGRHTVVMLKDYFDEIFGHIKKPEPQVIEKHLWYLIIWISLAIILFIFLGALTIYGLTPTGKEKYHNLYIYYFGKPEDYEKRWRYSCFADEQDGKNILLDAVREVNKVNLLIAVKKGAYIDAYNNFGNTALHAAVKGAYHELVDILIRHGADRTLLNTYNRTAQQMIPFRYGDLSPEKIERFDKIKKLFKKYQKKKFRKCVPKKFPVTSFHIFIEDRTDVELTNRFKDAFESITSIEVSPTTTHLVVKTTPDGILETDRLDLLFWIFNGAIIVKDSWMTDCLQNDHLINRDIDYLVEKVNYKGSCYDTVIQWSMAMAKSEIPYLFGVFVAVVMKEYDNMNALHSIVLCQGGVFLEEFPMKKDYRVGSHPYLHANLGPLFLIHDGSMDLSVYKNDKDKMYTLFTESEFISFMLKREIQIDDRPNPITVSKELE